MNAGIGVLAIYGSVVAGCVFAQWSSPPSRQVYQRRVSLAICGFLLVLGVAVAALVAVLAAYLAIRAGRDGLPQNLTPREMNTLAKGVLTAAISTSLGYFGLWAALGRRPKLSELRGTGR